jgi:selenium-binding protein 1
VHCGPDAIYISALGGTEDGKGPGGVFLLDHFSFEPLGAWEIDRGDQFLAYDFWWHYAHDIMITSEWGEPRQFENGVVPEDLLGKKYGHRIHFWDLRRRKRTQVIDIGDEHQMVLELRPAHDPRKTHGFFGVVISVADLSASVWAWYREKEQFKVKKIATIPAEPADPAQLPPALKPFKAVPPLVTDIDLSLDDRFLYVSCWGTGEMRQYDVSDPLEAKLTGTVQVGGIVRKAGHPKAGALKGGPQMVEISRDGKRVYFTNGLYSAWDEQFYPEGMPGWMVKLDVKPDGGIAVDPGFLATFGDARAHQVRLEGGDASTDTFCFPS